MPQTHAQKDLQSPQHQDHALAESGFDSAGVGQMKAAPPFQLKAEPSSSPGDSKTESDLGSELVGGFAASTGHDLSDVKVHRNSEEPGKVGAHAYAQGNDIHLGPGQEKHLPHEAGHIVQQREGRVKANTEVNGVQVNDDKGLESEADKIGENAVQMQAQSSQVGDVASGGPATNQVSQMRRAGGDSPAQLLIKDDYPWTGAIVGAWSAALQRRAGIDRSNPHAGTLADIPRGHLVTVTGRSGYWLKVEVEIGGGKKSGYISQELVDDATAASMSSMVGQKARWVPSGPGSGNSFETWASAASESEAPKLQPSTTINCWEMVLYAAYKAGAIDWNWIHDLYVNRSPSAWVSTMTRSEKAYSEGVTRLKRGELVFWDGLSHVGLATGRGDEVLTFWPPPDTPFTAGGTIDKVKTSTVKALSDWMETNFGDRPDVTYGAPAW